jgi:hypothetical protein
MDRGDPRVLLEDLEPVLQVIDVDGDRQAELDPPSHVARAQPPLVLDLDLGDPTLDDPDFKHATHERLLGDHGAGGDKAPFDVRARQAIPQLGQVGEREVAIDRECRGGE